MVDDRIFSGYGNDGSANLSPAPVTEVFGSWVDGNRKRASIRVYMHSNVSQGPDGWYVNNSSVSAAARIYDYNDNILKAFDDAGPEPIFQLTCNKFVQTVKPDGSNKAWVERVGTASKYPSNTPDFFVHDSTGFLYSDPWYQLRSYGRTNADNLFGAASFPEGFDLVGQQRIPLRNRYSSASAQPLAGRPYDCQNNDGNGCSLMGYCDHDNKVFCLVGHDNTCAINNANECKPLWYKDRPLLTSNSTPPDYSMLLSKLFLESYNGYSFSGNAYQTNPAVSYRDYTAPIPKFSVSDCTRSGEGLGSFCSVWPKLTRINLYYEDSATPFKSDPVSTQGFIITQKGRYRLEFNSKVDPEQQPLSNIEINWGDGNIQTITGQDEHPTDPHVFYHYYSQTGSTVLKITIKDNWGLYRSN
jgi:hypothetical protein